MKKSEFQFIKPYIEYISYTENEQFEKDGEEVSMDNMFKVEISDKGENKAKVSLLYQLNKDKTNAPFMMKAKISATFEWENFDDSTIDTMLHVNAPALLLGYLRPMVAGITNSSKFPSYNLPFINFQEN